MEYIHLSLGSNKKPNEYSEFFMRFSVLKRIALLFEYFYTKYPFMPYSNSFLSDQYSKQARTITSPKLLCTNLRIPFGIL